MQESLNKQRFLVCYKKNIRDLKTGEKHLQKFIKVFKSINQIECCNSLSKTLKIPNQYIRRNDNEEGILYCNPVYNPKEEEEIT